MGADAIKKLIDRIDLDEEEIKLREAIDPEEGQKPLSAQRKQKAIKRLKIVAAFNRRDEHGNRVNDPRAMILDVGPGHPAGPAPDGAARRWPLRHLGPQRPVPPRHQPQQPPEAAARPRRSRDHRQQREADAPGGRRRAVRQRPSWPSGHRSRQPPAQVALRHAQGQAGSVPPEPARQARRLLGSFGHRGRPDAPAAPVRSAEADGARAVQALRHEGARRPRARPEHQVRQAHGRASSSPGVGRARGRHQGAPGAPEPCPHAAPPRHPGLRADPGRGQGHPDPPAGVHRVQRRLRRRPDGGAPAAVRRGPGRGPGADAQRQQHAEPGPRQAAGHAHPGHDHRCLLPHREVEGEPGEGACSAASTRSSGPSRPARSTCTPRSPTAARSTPSCSRARPTAAPRPTARRPPVASCSTGRCPTASATSTSRSASGR